MVYSHHLKVKDTSVRSVLAYKYYFLAVYLRISNATAMIITRP